MSTGWSPNPQAWNGPSAPEQAVEAVARIFWEMEYPGDPFDDSNGLYIRTAQRALEVALPLMGVQHPEDVARSLKDALTVTSEHDYRPWSQIETALLALPKHTGQPQEGVARAGWKYVYAKRWRTLIYVPESIADEVRDVLASPPPPVAESGWQEIETAPKDEMFIWAAPKGDGKWSLGLAYRNVSGGWSDAYGSDAPSRATRWHPLPALPHRGKDA